MVKQIPANIYEVETYAHWSDIDSIIIYSRTSPDQDQSKGQRDGAYQRAAIERFASERGLKVAGIYPGVGEYGRRIGPKTTPNLIAAIEHATRTGFPVMVFDLQRLCREPHKLARYKVDFISLISLSVDASKLNGIRKKEANRFNPQGKGGRPRDTQAAFALPFILSQLGRPWAKIASEFGEGWSDNRVKRTLIQNFDYIDSTKLPIQEGSSPTAELTIHS